MKVAYYSPFPPERTGVADYSALLLPELRRHIEVRVVRHGRRRPPRRTDIALYHVGNDPDAHGWILSALRRRRGVVVLHDFVLHHLVAGLTLGRGDPEAYLDAMQRDGGVLGRLIAHGVIDGLLSPIWESRPEEFPLVHGVLDHADGVIVHSRYVESRVRQSGFRGPVWRIPHPASPEPGEVHPIVLPQPAAVVIGCFGNFNPSKRGLQLLKAFAGIRERHPDALLVFAGGLSGRNDLELHARNSGLRLGESVVHLGYVNESDIWPLLAACDVLVNLRWPTMGETSGSVIRALAAGRPVVVSDVGWFSELPEDVVAKVGVGPNEVEELREVLLRLIGDTELRARLGAAAQRYVRREHDLERVGEAYTIALEDAAGLELVRTDVLDDVSRAASDVGLTSSSPELSEVGRALSEVGLRDVGRSAINS